MSHDEKVDVFFGDVGSLLGVPGGASRPRAVATLAASVLLSMLFGCGSRGEGGVERATSPLLIGDQPPPPSGSLPPTCRCGTSLPPGCFPCLSCCLPPPSGSPGAPAPSSPKALAVSAGTLFACAVMSTGGVECWGDNAFGELGHGTTSGPETCSGFLGPAPCSTVPVAVLGVTTATAVSASYTYACALLANGTIDCWGNNGAGTLGDGTTISRPTAAPVQGVAGAIAVAAGPNGACALLSGGSVSCWGEGPYGPLGNSGLYASPTLVPVSGILGATAIASGRKGCAVLPAGSVDCWGFIVGGGSTTPAPVAGVNGAIGISTGEPSCAILADKSAICWDADDPAAATGLTGVTSIGAGSGFTCTSLSNGGASCWGSNTYGELGIGTSTGPHECDGFSCSTTAVSVQGLTGVTAVTAGDSFACAVLAGGGVKCWGNNGAGELGIGTSTGPQQCDGFPCSTTARSVPLF